LAGADPLRNREISSREAVESALARMEEVDPTVDAIVSVLAGEALRAADRADRAIAAGDEVGPLHGVPITTQINVDQEGLPTTNGDNKDA